MRRLPDPTSRLLVDADGKDRLGGAVPSPAAAFLLTLIALPSLFWLVTLKRTTGYTLPELSLMNNVVPAIRDWVEHTLPPLHAFLLGISALGSGWFVTAGFALLGLLALAKGRRDLALILAAGMLAFPIEWALKYFTAIPPVSPGQLTAAIFNVNGTGLDDLADFPAGHALRATVFYGLVAFCVARLAPDRRQGIIAYLVALILIGFISLTRIYLGAHFPIDVLGGWIAGAALLSVIVAVHVLGVDERLRASGHITAPPGELEPHKVAVPLHHTGDALGEPDR
ncbi:MAG TPA: phosphatase PAP2 family protein [Candidatus Limnocylindria bacterium]|nr:phosphatase PAP2 family protein [Candidatus Limnocylindria bacterium]